MKDIDHSRKKSRKRTRAEPVVRTKSSEAAEPASESRPEPEAEKTNSIKAEEVLHEGQDAAAQAPKEETKGESNSEPHNKSPAATDVTPAVQPPRFENKLRKKGFGLSVPLPPMPDVASILSGGGYAPQSMCNGCNSIVWLPIRHSQRLSRSVCDGRDERNEPMRIRRRTTGVCPRKGALLRLQLYHFSAANYHVDSPCVAHMSASMGYNRDPFLSPAFSAFRPGDNMGFYSPVPSANVYAQQQRSDKKD